MFLTTLLITRNYSKLMDSGFTTIWKDSILILKPLTPTGS